MGYIFENLFINVKNDLMFYFIFPSLRLHVHYMTLTVSSKVLDMKWAIYQNCWLALEN